jgi:hypothetical protein
LACAAKSAVGGNVRTSLSRLSRPGDCSVMVQGLLEKVRMRG